jgi:type IV pilus modification protein PilV
MELIMRNCQGKSKTNEPKKKSRVRDNGFTLMEILIALSILSIGILAVTAMQIRSMQVNSLASNITESTTWAQDKMEDLISRSWTDPDLAAGTQNETAQDGTLVTWTVTDVDMDGVIGTVELKRITIQSTYNDGLGNTKTLRVSSAYPRLAAPS